MTAISVAEAVARILETATTQPSLRLPLADAPGHVLAVDVPAPWPLPPWTAASMDGYAVHGDDLRGANAGSPVTLPLAGGGHAGDAPPPPLAPGTAWRVATGGRVPEGADSVIRQEDTAPAGAPLRGARSRPTSRSGMRDAGSRPAAISFTSDRDVGRNVRPRGGDVAAGDVALRAGTLITPGVVALLAALGEATPVVIRRPRVGIIASGNEVASLDHPEALASGGRLADVNTPMLVALVRQAGGVPVPLGLLPDDADALRNAVERAGHVDLLLTAGAVSVGEHDHVPAVMAALGAEIVFRRVRIRPGGPTTLARLPDGEGQPHGASRRGRDGPAGQDERVPGGRQKRVWLALPGNPVSAFVTFHVFAKPAIRKMMGVPRPPAEPERQPALSSAKGGLLGWNVAILAEPVARHPTLDLYLRVSLEPDPAGGPPLARLTGNQGSWVTSSVASADGLVVVEAGEGEVAAGSTARCTVLEN